LKKVFMLLTTVIPVIIVSILATVVLPMFFGQAMKGILPIVMVVFALATIGITILVIFKKRKGNQISER